MNTSSIGSGRSNLNSFRDPKLKMKPSAKQAKAGKSRGPSKLQLQNSFDANDSYDAGNATGTNDSFDLETSVIKDPETGDHKVNPKYRKT